MTLGAAPDREAKPIPDDLALLAEFTLPSEPGNERLAMQRVGDAVRVLGLSTRRLERLGTAVAEATMNAMEHGHHFRSDAPVLVQVHASRSVLSVRIIDEGGAPSSACPELPDLDAKLVNLQAARGWGRFLIAQMVDEVHESSDESTHIVELVLRREKEE